MVTKIFNKIHRISASAPSIDFSSVDVFFDRTIPHCHPYIELVEGECHYVAQDERYPNLAFHFDTDV